MRASRVPVVVYVAPKNAIAGSAGALITMAGHASAMAPETAIGASTPINSSGENLNSDERTKATNASKAAIRDIVAPHGEEALKLAKSMIDEAKAASAKEALAVHLVDFVVDNVDDLLESLDGFSVQVNNESHTLHTANARTEPLEMSFIERFLLLLTDPNIVFSLLSIGGTALLIELSSPGGWVAGFFGVVCLSLAATDWAFCPSIGLALSSDHRVCVVYPRYRGAYTGALIDRGVASSSLVPLCYFNSATVPQFQRVSVPLVIRFESSWDLYFSAS